jgi:hypothetical protein
LKNNQKPYFWVFFSTKHRKVSHFGKGKVKKCYFDILRGFQAYSYGRRHLGNQKLSIN